MKKFKLFSGIGLLSALFLSIIYLCVAEKYGLWTEKTLYVSLLDFVIIIIYILFVVFCIWLISDGSEWLWIDIRVSELLMKYRFLEMKTNTFSKLVKMFLRYIELDFQNCQITLLIFWQVNLKNFYNMKQKSLM